MSARRHTSMLSLLVGTFALLLLSFNSVSASGQPQIKPLAFGIVPQQSARRLAQQWVPVLRWLSEKSGVELQFATAKDISTFERRVAAGKYDIAYMNPYHYTVFHRRPGYRAFAKQKGKQIRGIIVIRKGSRFRDIADLDGETLAFPSPAAFGASVLPQARLAQGDIDVTPVYVSSHDSVYLAIAKGVYPAGGGIMRTFNSMDKSVRDQLRVMWTTDGYTPHAFAAHPRVPDDLVARLLQAMTAIVDDPQGRILLAPIRFTGIEAANDPDWDDVRALDIRILDPLTVDPE